ncbi:MAG: bifunctional [glutamate--ammonia ligase]-adenylyl-L-tyrosine phosphorylase/[glutamate--ammonia-ligase] adenylyltransferase [Gammaproteobacteria bacterium]
MSDAAAIPRPDGLPAALADEYDRLVERYTTAAAAADAGVVDDRATLRAFAISPFMAEVAIRRPAAFAAAIDDGAAPRSRADYDALLGEALAGATDTAAVKQALRCLRQVEMARLAWRDIVLGIDVIDIMTELSAFADAVVQAAVRWLGGALAPRFGRALDADGEPLELCVIGMGKLGGHELNFSSDIDLLFVFGESGETQGGRKSVEHQAYFDRLGREFIALLNETTSDGQVFRVDMRLRPFGDSGPLSSSLAALEHYYTAHGRDWERYALIKARPITGDEATRTGFEELRRPFVYRRYLDYGAVEALREMKQLISREAGAAELADNVKRGPGGIREIEFSGQLFQLTRGGREASLRRREIVAVLARAAELGLIERDAAAALTSAYRFLRTTEHRLQQVHDWQTHSLPTDAVERERLAFALGEADWTSCRARIDGERQTVRRIFDGLLKESAEAPASDAWSVLWREAGGGADLPALARAAGWDLEQAGAAAIGQLAGERFLGRLSGEARQRLDRLMPLLLERAAARALSTRAVEHLARLLHAIARRSVYMLFLADNPQALERLLELFDASPWIADQIVAHPLLLDELLDHRVLFAPPDEAALAELARAAIDPAEGLERSMENLRAFRNQQVLRVAASDVTGHLPVAEVSNQLSYIAAACIERAVTIAWGEMTARYGEPCCEDEDGGRRTAGFAVIGYGKLGGFELGYGSDLDLVFLNDSSGRAEETNGSKSIENSVFFARLAQRFIHVLSTTTPTGVAYEVDTRLRPSGSAGMMVVPVTAYARYLGDEAWTWEHQALVRARGIAGDSTVLERFAAIRTDTLCRERDAGELRAAVAEMRQRMLGELDRSDAARFDLKQGAGGTTDIEFMVQYAVLRWAHAHPALLAWTDNLRLLETIAELGLLPAASCRRLHEAYFAYRAAIHRCTLQQVDALVDADSFGEHRGAVIEIWKSLIEQGTGQETTA